MIKFVKKSAVKNNIFENEAWIKLAISYLLISHFEILFSKNTPQFSKFL